MDNSFLLSPKGAVTGREWSDAQAPSEKEVNLKRDHASVNAVSFGFVATAVLISMFLVMAIFERFLRPRSSFSPLSPDRDRQSTVSEGAVGAPLKRDLQTIEYTSGISVLMPGQDLPTFIAKPVPILCPREGISYSKFTRSLRFDSNLPYASTEKIQEELTDRDIDSYGSSSVPAPHNSAQ